MRCFLLAIHVAKRHLVLYVDVEFNTFFFSSLAVSSVVSSLAVKRICKRRPVRVFGKQAQAALDIESVFCEARVSRCRRFSLAWHL